MTKKLDFLKHAARLMAIALCTVPALYSCDDDPVVDPNKPIIVTGVVLTPETAELAIGDSLVLTVTIQPSIATNKNISWTSSDSTVATVTNGTVIALQAGETTITVTTEDGSKTDQCEITVNTNPTAVTGVALNVSDTILSPIETLTLIADVQPASAANKAITWSSDNEAVATVDTNGIVTPHEYGEAVITVITEDGNQTAVCTVTVNLIGTVTFKSDSTWAVGTQVWSDAIMATGAKKDDFNGGTHGSPDYYADCRQNEGYGDWFSWEAINQYKEQICPEGWRLPTKEDFIELDILLGGNGENRMLGDGLLPYLEVWGAKFGGYCWWYQGLLQLSYVGEYGGYWAETEASATQGCALNLGTAYGYVTPQATSDKYSGYTVRLIKDDN